MGAAQKKPGSHSWDHWDRVDGVVKLKAPGIKIFMDTEGLHSVPVTSLQVVPSLR